MKILILSPNPPWSLGGVERVVKETTLRIAKRRDADIEIWSKGSKNEIIFWNEIKVRIFKTTLFGVSLSMIKELRKLQKQFDIIHIHGTSNIYPFEVLLSLENWKNVIVSPHYHPRGSTLLFKLTKPVYDRLIVLNYLRKARKIICVSETEKEILKKQFKIADFKIVVIPNGIPIEKIRKAKSYNFNGKLILYIGRLEKYKNIHFAIEATRFLPENYYFYIIGKGKFQIELEKRVNKYGLSGRVKILNNISDEDLYRWLKTSSLVINLSNIEAFGITVIEALSAGKPVIVNNRLGLAELARKFKEAVIPVDLERLTPKELAEIIENVINRYGSVSSLSLDLKNYDWEVISNKIVKIYKTLYNSLKVS